MLQNRNVSSAIVGASRPEQVRDNVKAAGVKLDAAIMKRIDEVLGDVGGAGPEEDREPGRSGRRAARRNPAADGISQRMLQAPCEVGAGGREKKMPAVKLFRDRVAMNQQEKHPRARRTGRSGRERR